MNSNFTSRNNDKVINIGDNHAPIYTSDKESTEKNQAHINNSGNTNSTINNYIYQNKNSYQFFGIVIIIFAIFAFGILVLSRLQPTVNTNILGSKVSSIANTQPNTISENTNTIVINANQSDWQSKVDYPKATLANSKNTKPKDTSNSLVKKTAVRKEDKKSNSNSADMDCLSHPNGCQN